MTDDKVNKPQGLLRVMHDMSMQKQTRIVLAALMAHGWEVDERGIWTKGEQRAYLSRAKGDVEQGIWIIEWRGMFSDYDPYHMVRGILSASGEMAAGISCPHCGRYFPGHKHAPAHNVQFVPPDAQAETMMMTASAHETAVPMPVATEARLCPGGTD